MRLSFASLNITCHGKTKLMLDLDLVSFNKCSIFHPVNTFAQVPQTCCNSQCKHLPLGFLENTAERRHISCTIFGATIRLSKACSSALRIKNNEVTRKEQDHGCSLPCTVKMKSKLLSSKLRLGLQQDPTSEKIYFKRNKTCRISF